MRQAMRTAVGLCLLTLCATATAQDGRDAERPIPPLQFGTTGSFSGFQFQQATFGSAIGAPIPFEGIQFPGFGAIYDVSRRDGRQVPREDAPIEGFNGRFAPSRFADDRRSHSYWRMNRSDPFAVGAVAAPASREAVARSRRPFGVLSEDDARSPRRTSARSSPVQRIASQAETRSARRPFPD